jgi:hypothetical protein
VWLRYSHRLQWREGALIMEIASRILTLRDVVAETKIPIRIFAPECEQTGSWGCRYEIEWPGGTKVKTIFGVDSIQALLLTMQIIGVEIYSSELHKSGNLYFDKPGNGYGFPVMPTLRDLLQGDDQKYL